MARRISSPTRILQTFFAIDWEVHYNSSRTGVRLIGPKPQWARSDGGEAGLHPSNIHDNAYAIGSGRFHRRHAGDPRPDGPSLGGFVCPVTIVQAELWKMGQLKPGDTVRFCRMSMEQALALEKAAGSPTYSPSRSACPKSFHRSRPASDKLAGRSPRLILHSIPQSSGQVQVVYRQAGDKYLLVEYGPLELDLNLRFRAHALME